LQTLSSTNLPNLTTQQPTPTVPDAGPPTKPRPSFARWLFACLGTLIGVSLPVLGVAAAIVFGILWGVSWVDVSLLVVMYLASMLGVTVGFHRLFTHRAFQTYRPIQWFFAICGSMSLQGPMIPWVGLHRLHHQHSDHDGDPHSPYPHGQGIWGLLKGFWHAHIGWAFAPMPDGLERYAGDLRRSPTLRFVSALFPLWALLGMLIPAGIGWALGGWKGLITGFIWGGLVRVFLGHHATWCVNSVCHLWGKKPYASGDESRNNLFVGLYALGEGWHNNHHAFPRSARHGLARWEIDVSYLVIRAAAALRLAHDVQTPTDAQVREALAHKVA
jgi:stearoyl-CoA desaturase (delta-9 desaturase)